MRIHTFDITNTQIPSHELPVHIKWAWDMGYVVMYDGKAVNNINILKHEHHKIGLH